MLIAVTRAVSPAINQCELGYLERQPIDYSAAESQHRQYEAALGELGAKVISLPAEPDYPDSVFVEDPAVVVDEIAVMTRMGVDSRRGETDSLARELAKHRKLHHIVAPATLEGGDVMRIGRKLYVGISHRSNPAGVEQLAAALRPFDYEVIPVTVRGALHLKTACCHLGDGMILANREWLDTTPLREYPFAAVAPEEPRAANVLALGGAILMPDCFPRTAEVLEKLGKRIKLVNVTELMKAEAGVTCSSLIFQG